MHIKFKYRAVKELVNKHLLAKKGSHTDLPEEITRIFGSVITIFKYKGLFTVALYTCISNSLTVHFDFKAAR